MFALRELAEAHAGDVVERVKFGCLSYFRPDRAYGSIGGNVCMIHVLTHHVRLEFLHGIALPDPTGLLRGRGKAKRYVAIRYTADAHRPALADLVRAAAAYCPPGTEQAVALAGRAARRSRAPARSAQAWRSDHPEFPG